jgi:ribosome-binding factor A
VSQRTERIDELLRQEIGAVLSREIGDPRIGFATITDVETAPDLSHARVWVSVIGQPEERRATLIALSRAMPFVRRQLGPRLHIRRIPELHVQLDDTAQRGSRVLKLLAEIEAGTTLDVTPPADETLPTPVARLPHEGDAAEPGEPVPDATTPRRRRRTRSQRPSRRG